MSKLVVAFFKNPSHADRALKALMRLPLHKEILDACAVIRMEDGAITLHQAKDRVFPYLYGGLVIGALAGVLCGWLIWNIGAGLVTGFVLGGIMGALWGALNDYGIEDALLERLGSSLKPETSALFLLFRKNVPKGALRRLQHWRARIIHAPVTGRAEETLKQQLVLLQKDIPAHPLPAAMTDVRPAPGENKDAR